MDIAAILKLLVGIISGKGGAAAIGALIALVLVYGKKYVPAVFGNAVARKLDEALTNLDKIQDPKRKELVENLAYDLVLLAEHEIPEAGQGRARYEAVAAKLVALVPAFKGQEKALTDVIEAAVTKMDDALKKKIADRKQP